MLSPCSAMRANKRHLGMAPSLALYGAEWWALLYNQPHIPWYPLYEIFTAYEEGWVAAADWTRQGTKNPLLLTEMKPYMSADN
jgi:hypothetical protein